MGFGAKESRMFGTSGPLDRILLRRVAVLTAALVPMVLVFLLTMYWLADHVPARYFWKTGLIFLIALEIAYWLVALLTLLGIVALGLLRLRVPRYRRHPAISRGLLLCVSLIFGLIASETVGVIWQFRSNQLTAVPIGGLRLKSISTQSSPAVLTSRDVPLPTTFAEAKKDGEIDLVVVGESSAQGVPYDFWVSIGHIIGWQLKEAIPGRTIRLNIVALSGDTLEKQHAKLGTLSRRPDALIIYCGHNEFSARFPWSSDPHHYFDDLLPSAWDHLAERMEDVSPLTKLIHQTEEQCRIAIPPPPNGSRALVDVPVYRRADYDAILIDFRRRLELIVSYAERIGALPILIVPPANDAGFEPNRSFLPTDTAREEREAFRNDFLTAGRIEGTEPKRSVELYRALLARQPGFAETHYRIAQLLERDGAWDEAYQHYVMARDFDGYPMRMLSAFQHIYHEVAAGHDSILIDGQSYFHTIGRHGLLDDALFQDGIHPSLRGQIALAQAVLQALQKRRAFGWPHNSPASVIDPASVVKHFGLTPEVWRRICLWGIMFYDLTTGVRYDSSHRLQMKVTLATAAVRIKAGEAPESVGLPNVGVPEPVPDVPMPDSDRSSR
jgi:lysophospholipase L1-like esterase